MIKNLARIATCTTCVALYMSPTGPCACVCVAWRTSGGQPKTFPIVDCDTSAFTYRRRRHMKLMSTNADGLTGVGRQVHDGDFSTNTPHHWRSNQHTTPLVQANPMLTVARPSTSYHTIRADPATNPPCMQPRVEQATGAACKRLVQDRWETGWNCRAFDRLLRR